MNQYSVSIDGGKRFDFDAYQENLQDHIIVGGRGRLLDDFVSAMNDGALHQVDFFVVSDQTMSNVDTTGVDPMESFASMLYVGNYKMADANNLSHDVSLRIVKK